jgi:hypothetical protein
MLYNYGSNRQDETARAWPWEDRATICALLAQAEDWPLAKEDVHCTHEWTWVRTETYVLAQGQMPVIKASYNAQDFLSPILYKDDSLHEIYSHAAQLMRT